MATGRTRRAAPDITVAVLALREGRLLCVEELIQGRPVLNQPAGHLEPGESLIDAAVRETREEAGWNVRVTGLVGVYQWPLQAHETCYLRFAFAAEAIDAIPNATLDTGIVQALWLHPEALLAQSARHRSPLVWRAAADFLAGSRQPLELLHALP